MVFVWHYVWFSVPGSHLSGSPESSTFSQASCLCVTSMIYKYRLLWSRTASSGRRARHIDPSCSIKLLLRLISHSQVNNSLYWWDCRRRHRSCKTDDNFFFVSKKFPENLQSFQAVSHRVRKLNATHKLHKLHKLLFLRAPTMHLSVSVGRSLHLCMTPDACYANCSTPRQPRERGGRRWLRSNLFRGTFFPHQPVRTVTSCRNLTLHVSWKAQLGIIFERIQAMTQGKHFSAQFEHFKIFWVPLNNMFKNVPNCGSSWLMCRWFIQGDEGKWLFIKKLHEGFGILVEDFNTQMKKCKQQKHRCGSCVYMRRPQQRYTSLGKKKYTCFKHFWKNIMKNS